MSWSLELGLAGCTGMALLRFRPQGNAPEGVSELTAQELIRSSSALADLDGRESALQRASRVRRDVPLLRVQTLLGAIGCEDVLRMVLCSRGRGLRKDGSSPPRSCKSLRTASSRVSTTRSPSAQEFSKAGSVSVYGGHGGGLGPGGLGLGDLLDRKGQDEGASLEERSQPPKGPRGPRTAPPEAGSASPPVGTAGPRPARGPRILLCMAGNMFPGTRSPRSISAAPICRGPTSGVPPARAPARSATCPGLGW